MADLLGALTTTGAPWNVAVVTHRILLCPERRRSDFITVRSRMRALIRLNIHTHSPLSIHSANPRRFLFQNNNACYQYYPHAAISALTEQHLPVHIGIILFNPHLTHISSIYARAMINETRNSRLVRQLDYKVRYAVGRRKNSSLKGIVRTMMRAFKRAHELNWRRSRTVRRAPLKHRRL